MIRLLYAEDEDGLNYDLDETPNETRPLLAELACEGPGHPAHQIAAYVGYLTWEWGRPPPGVWGSFSMGKDDNAVARAIDHLDRVHPGALPQALRDAIDFTVAMDLHWEALRMLDEWDGQPD